MRRQWQVDAEREREEEIRRREAGDPEQLDRDKRKEEAWKREQDRLRAEQAEQDAREAQEYPERMRRLIEKKRQDEETARKNEERELRFNNYIRRVQDTVGKKEFDQCIKLDRKNGLNDLLQKFRDWEFQNHRYALKGQRQVAWGDHGKQACYLKLVPKKYLGMSVEDYCNTAKEDENVWIFPGPNGRVFSS